jgi:hypothetical protein
MEAHQYLRLFTPVQKFDFQIHYSAPGKKAGCNWQPATGLVRLLQDKNGKHLRIKKVVKHETPQMKWRSHWGTSFKILTYKNTSNFAKLIASQTLNKLPTFYRTRRSTAVSTRAATGPYHSLLHPVHITEDYFSKIYLNIILPSVRTTFKWSLSFQLKLCRPVQFSATYATRTINLNLLNLTPLVIRKTYGTA